MADVSSPNHNDRTRGKPTPKQRRRHLTRLQQDLQLSRFWAHRGADGVKRELQLLIDYLCSCAGGPVYYRGQDMELTHRRMRISESDWNVFLGHAAETLRKFQVLNSGSLYQDRAVTRRVQKSIAALRLRPPGVRSDRLPERGGFELSVPDAHRVRSNPKLPCRMSTSRVTPHWLWWWLSRRHSLPVVHCPLDIFTDALPMETCETAPEVGPDPIFARLNFSSADNTGVDF
jgi:hypothetical protein